MKKLALVLCLLSTPAFAGPKQPLAPAADASTAITRKDIESKIAELENERNATIAAYNGAIQGLKSLLVAKAPATVAVPKPPVADTVPAVKTP